MPDVMVNLVCDACGGKFKRRAAEVRHRRRTGLTAHDYCTRECAHTGRRVGRTREDKRQRKAAYDRQRRNGEKREAILAEKRAHHAATYTPAKGRAFRERRKAQGWDHSAYCRDYFAADPARKAGKVAYDLERRAARYGEFGEAWKVLVALKRETCAMLPGKYERAIARGYYERNAQQRRRHAQDKRASGNQRVGRSTGRRAPQG